MSRFFGISFIALVLVISATGAAPVAHAVGYTSSLPGDTTLTPDTTYLNPALTGPATQSSGSAASSFNTGDSCTAAGGLIGTKDATGNCIASSNSGTASAADAASPTPLPANPVNDAAYAGIIQWIMKLFAWLVGVAAITLDNAVYYTVVTMGSYVKNLAAVGVTWRILRDIGNIMLIFGFLAVGITTILNVDWYGGGKKMLPMMLVAAVFLNFSLFISEAIIDTGNLFATQFYTQINGGNPAGAKNFDLTSINNDGISNKIMGQLGLQGIYSDTLRNTEIFKAGNSWIIGFMGIILFIVTAFVLFSLAFVLIARFVVLIFLIILAPVGFAGLAVPQLKSTAKKWWNALFEQTITAPVLLLTLYIALAVITDAKFMTGFGSSSNSNGWTGTIRDAAGVGNLTGFAGLLLSFLVAMGLLLAVILFSKKLSAFGADFASQTAGKLTFGATAWGMNRTVGRGAYHLGRVARQSQTFNKVNAWTGRALSGTLDRVATGSFDVRGTSALKNFPGGSIDAGAAQKGGFTEARKQNIKGHEEEVKRIEEAHKEALKNTPEDLETIANAEENRKKAEAAKNTVQKAKDVAQAAKQEAETRRLEDKAELDRLAAIDKTDRDAGRPSSVGNALREAQQKFGTSDTNFTAATSNLTKAVNALKVAAEAETAAEKEKTTAEGAAETRMKASIKANKIAYAEGIDHPLNPITFVAYGPDTAAAARKIIKDANSKKSTKDQLADLAKKVIKEEEDAKKISTGEEEEEKREEQKPAPKPEEVK